MTTQSDPQKEIDRLRDTLSRIAELNGPIECTSLQNWREKAQKMALNALNGRKS